MEKTHQPEENNGFTRRANLAFGIFFGGMFFWWPLALFLLDHYDPGFANGPDHVMATWQIVVFLLPQLIAGFIVLFYEREGTRGSIRLLLAGLGVAGLCALGMALGAYFELGIGLGVAMAMLPFFMMHRIVGRWCSTSEETAREIMGVARRSGSGIPR